MLYQLSYKGGEAGVAKTSGGKTAVLQSHSQAICRLFLVLSLILIISQYLLTIINWVVRALNADWLTAVVYQTVFHS
jgi:hypothetical protein